MHDDDLGIAVKRLDDLDNISAQEGFDARKPASFFRSKQPQTGSMSSFDPLGKYTCDSGRKIACHGSGHINANSARRLALSHKRWSSGGQSYEFDLRWLTE